MKRAGLVLVIAGIAVILTAVVPSRAEARHNLAHRVKALEAKISCIKRAAVSHYLGYAWYEDNGTVHVLQDTVDFSDSFSAVAFGQAFRDTDPPDYWVLAIRNTRTCRARFGVVANPFAVTTASLAAQAKMRRLAPAP